MTFFSPGLVHGRPAENLPQPATGSGEVAIAAASNLVYALDALCGEFRTLRPGVAVRTATGASGSLVAQIAHGAPYDVFLSADLEYPQALIASGHAGQDKVTTFATGHLVLWSGRELPLEPIGSAVRDQRMRRIAIANPASAPYGRAAREALLALEAWAEVQPKIVTGENISQTAQFVETGNADAGFVALSLVLSPRLAGRGHWVLVPDGLHAPLAHGAVLTRRGAGNAAAAEFLAFLGSPAAQEVLARFGYGPP